MSSSSTSGSGSGSGTVAPVGRSQKSVSRALAIHGVPCVLSAVAAGLLTWLWCRSKEQQRRQRLARADAAYGAQHGMTPSEFERAAKDLVDRVIEYRTTLADRPSVKSTVEPGYLRQLVPGSAPAEGEAWSTIASDIDRVIMPGVTHWGSPNFFAYFPAFASYPSLLGEFLCSSLNSIAFSWIGSPAATELETLCLDWVAQMANLPEHFMHSSETGGGGCIQGTAAEAGAVALLAGRAKACEGLTPEEAEVHASKLVAYISDQTHGIIAKGCKIVGVPASRLRILKTTAADNFGLTLAAVQEAMLADEAAGRVPYFLCLTIGSTSSTAIDAIPVIARWVQSRFPRVFLHIDAAYAGAFAILPERRPLFAGVELVDSFSFNPHKSLLIAFDCSLFYVRQRTHLLAALSLTNDGEYLRNAATESGKVLDLKDWQLPFGRRFRALKLWFTIRSYGHAGVRRHLRSAIENADVFQQKIRASSSGGGGRGRWQLECQPLHFGLVCFTLAPPASLPTPLTQAEVNALNESLKERCNATGRIFFITTVLAGRTILRLACNGETQQGPRDCERAWQVIEQERRKMWQERGWPEEAGSASSASATSAPSVSLVSPIGSSSGVAASVPVIDISPLLVSTDSAGRQRVAREIYAACTTFGFFYVSHHGVPVELQQRLESLSQRFFALPLEEKRKVRMELGGLAWRGWFPCGDELTSGKPDQKEGYYLGTELPADHPMVQRAVPMHGANLFPSEAVLPGLRATVLEWIQAMTDLGHAVMEGIALALGLDAQHFRRRLTKDPTCLFRIFNYPEHPKKQEGATGAAAEEESWGVGEHTDYGLLTILKQDDSGGLQVRAPNTLDQWLEAPPIANTFVVNIGDMLDRMTGGRFRSTPHRVRNLAQHDRLSWPFFFDPAWDAEVEPLQLDHLPKPIIQEDQQLRWDKASVHTLTGKYGQYLLRKVGKVFPELGKQHIQRGY